MSQDILECAMAIATYPRARSRGHWRAAGSGAGRDRLLGLLRRL